MKAARPFLKWAGGKTQLLPELLKRVPRSFETYFEPFLGGGALFWTLRPKNAFLSDANPELVVTYRAIRDHVEDVIDRLQSLAEHHSPTLFETLRREDWNKGMPFDTAARMIYLNKTCFNGIYRVNSRGEFNVPIGRFERPPLICDADNLRACAKVLQGAEIQNLDFKKAAEDMCDNDFAYFDPPYVPMSTTADFTSFTSAGFGPADQLRLAGEAAHLKSRGVHVLLSNSGVPVVRSIYQFVGMKVETVKARRNINCDGTRRGQVKEFLIS